MARGAQKSATARKKLAGAVAKPYEPTPQELATLETYLARKR